MYGRLQMDRNNGKGHSRNTRRVVHNGMHVVQRRRFEARALRSQLWVRAAAHRLLARVLKRQPIDPLSA